MKGKRSTEWLIPMFLLIAAILIILDQTVRYGVVWQWDQVLHHENFALALISLALGMLLSQNTSREKKEKSKT